ncbi:MAG TPA: hypothetical protein VLV86_06650 [Vicinamibacterales bacterium]|nr:hypothetical protein [Vicinamibacterales bacterium]
MRILLRTLVVTVAAAVMPVAASAGQLGGTIVDQSTQQSLTAPGWSVTPSLLFSRMYDDNVLLRLPGDQTIEDYVNIVNPRGEVTYHGRLSDFSAQYNGSFVAYRQATTLNSYDQQGGMTAKRRLSKRNTFFFSATAQESPTTELLAFVGVPYIRVGSFTDSASAGVETLVNKRLTIVTTATFQQARFDQNQFASLLLGGNSIGGAIALREQLTARTTLTADADFQHATIGTSGDVFDIENGTVGLDHELTRNMHVFAAGGISRLDVSAFGPTRVGPSWRVGLSDHYRGTIIDLGFFRSYVPSFGFGGTMQNEEANASIKMPLTRRIYVQGVVSRRNEDALVFTIPSLRSTWIQAVLGYAASNWVHIEGYYAGTRQTIGVPNELLGHDQVGVQVIASKPLRIR